MGNRTILPNPFTPEFVNTRLQGKRSGKTKPESRDSLQLNKPPCEKSVSLPAH